MPSEVIQQARITYNACVDDGVLIYRSGNAAHAWLARRRLIEQRHGNVFRVVWERGHEKTFDAQARAMGIDIEDEDQ